MILEASPYKHITTEYYQNFKQWLSESGNISACAEAGRECQKTGKYV